jgi:hypothetical protein
MSNVYELKPKDPDQTHARETVAPLLELDDRVTHLHVQPKFPGEATCYRSKCPHTMDVYFGGCPECGGVDGWIKTGRKDNWCYCLQHRTIWWGNDFIGDGEVASTVAIAAFSDFREVKSYTCPVMVAELP